MKPVFWFSPLPVGGAFLRSTPAALEHESSDAACNKTHIMTFHSRLLCIFWNLLALHNHIWAVKHHNINMIKKNTVQVIVLKTKKWSNFSICAHTISIFSTSAYCIRFNSTHISKASKLYSIKTSLENFLYKILHSVIWLIVAICLYYLKVKTF